MVRKWFNQVYSIRWRLPLSYAGIALLTAVALNGLLLFTLRSYYNQREHDYLVVSGQALTRQAERMIHDQLSTSEIQSAISLTALVVQARIELMDVNHQVIADSGSLDELEQMNVGFVRQNSNDSPIAVIGPDREEIPYLTGPPEPGTSQERGSQDEPYRYPIEVQRGPFGRLRTDDASPGRYSDQKATVPVYDPSGNLVGYLKLSDGPEFGSTIVEDVAEKGTIAGAIAVLIAAAAGFFISRSINHPVLALVAVTRQMARGDLAARVDLNRRDEFGLLAKTFNRMADRVETTVTTLKRFVEDAAHELNTPLTALRTNLELTTIYDMPESAHSDIEKALIELTRLEKLTRGLLTLARLEAPDAVTTRNDLDLTALARQMWERYASRAEQAGVSLLVEIPPDPICVEADQVQITRVIDNLLDNALKFTPNEGRITLGLKNESEQASLWVEDTGIGIPEADLTKLFSRFHRGRNAAAYPGNGLGLAIVKSIIEDHGGTITVTSGSGTTRFLVNLPCKQKG
jgi:signal transduction histidine kinase